MKKISNFLIKSLVGFGLIVGLSGCMGPSDAVVKSIASNYNVGSSSDEIKIIKSYENAGKTVMILQIGKSICEMPMIDINNNWTATGIKCQR